MSVFIPTLLAIVCVGSAYIVTMGISILFVIFSVKQNECTEEDLEIARKGSEVGGGGNGFVAAPLIDFAGGDGGGGDCGG